MKPGTMATPWRARTSISCASSELVWLMLEGTKPNSSCTSARSIRSDDGPVFSQVVIRHSRFSIARRSPPLRSATSGAATM